MGCALARLLMKNSIEGFCAENAGSRFGRNCLSHEPGGENYLTACLETIRPSRSNGIPSVYIVG